MTKSFDLKGVRFGRLVAQSRAPKDPSGHAAWVWICDCGNVKTLLATNVKTGKVQSCGCVQQESRTTHGYAGSRTYQAWLNMKARVGGKQSPEHYRDRGISMDDRWLSFENFREDMGDCPEGLTLDRRDNNGNYTKENCRWATRQQQVANTRRCRMVTVNDTRMCLAEACRAKGLLYRSVMRRIQKGMTPQEAIDYRIESR